MLQQQQQRVVCGTSVDVVSACVCMWCAAAVAVHGSVRFGCRCLGSCTMRARDEASDEGDDGGNEERRAGGERERVGGWERRRVGGRAVGCVAQRVVLWVLWVVAVVVQRGAETVFDRQEIATVFLARSLRQRLLGFLSPGSPVRCPGIPRAKQAPVGSLGDKVVSAGAIRNPSLLRSLLSPPCCSPCRSPDTPRPTRPS